MPAERPRNRDSLTIAVHEKQVDPMDTGYSMDEQFMPSLTKLAPSDSHRVINAINKYTKAPDSPGLNLEQLEGRTGKRRLWTIRASQELRVLLARDGPTWVFLRAGHHDEIYDLAERRTFVVPVDGHPGLISIRPRPPDFGDSAPHRVAEPRQSPYDSKPTIVEHWTTGELARAEFGEDEIDRLRRATPDTLLEVWPTITDEKLDRVIECSEMSPDEWFARDLFADETDDESRHKRFRDAIVERGALAGLSSLLSPQELQRLMSAPIEDWMIFLHPDQRALVERRFSGPARVRGSAGTGKTVVALHRAAVLAKRFTGSGGRARKAPPSILFTTFVRSLTPVLRICITGSPPRSPGLSSSSMWTVWQVGSADNSVSLPESTPTPRAKASRLHSPPSCERELPCNELG